MCCTLQILLLTDVLWNLAQVLNICNRMAVHCEYDFSQSKVQFNLWRSLCAYTACVEILRLDATHRDVNHYLTDELRSMMGIDAWLAVEENMHQYEFIVALFNEFSKNK